MYAKFTPRNMWHDIEQLSIVLKLHKIYMNLLNIISYRQPTASTTIVFYRISKTDENIFINLW